MAVQTVVKRTASIVGIILLGALGMGLFQISLHLWQDHLNLHALVNLVQQASQAKEAK